MCLEVVVVVEFENVHGKNDSKEVAKCLCAYGRVRAIASIKVVSTSVNTFVVWNISIK